MRAQELPHHSETDAVAAAGLPGLLRRIDARERRRRRMRRTLAVGVPSALVVAGLALFAVPVSPLTPFGGGASTSPGVVAGGSVPSTAAPSGPASQDPVPAPPDATDGGATDDQGQSAAGGAQSGLQHSGGLTLLCRADGRVASSDTPVSDSASADPAALCATLLDLPTGSLDDAEVCTVPGGAVAVYAAPATCAAHGQKPWKG